MKKSEMKELMKEAILESLGESFIPSLIEVVIKSTEKTIEKKLDESLKEALKTRPAPKRAVNEGKRTAKKPATRQRQAPTKQRVLAKDPVMNKLLLETMATTRPEELAEYGSDIPDMSDFSQNYQTQMLMQEEYQREPAQIMPKLPVTLSQDSLKGSVMDNSALAGVFKKDYRSVLKKMENTSGGGIPEAVQFFKAE